MQRTLDPAQIEAFAERSIPRVRTPDPRSLFAQRARRLLRLAERHALGDYLRLMATLAERQQVALDALIPALQADGFTQQVGRQIEVAHEHHMPVLPAAGWVRSPRWLSVLEDLCASVAKAPGFPPGVRSVCERLATAAVGARVGAQVQVGAQAEVGAQAQVGVQTMPGQHSEIEAQADLLLGARTAGVDPTAAPFLMAALQVYWAGMAATLASGVVRPIDVPGVCPLCGTLPVASVVRADKQSAGYRYLHCALCATEWHLVRITCSHCFANDAIDYHSIEGGTAGIRAEGCGGCGSYRKILYLEQDPAGEPVADDLGTVALDLLMTEAGFHRASGNPLLLQRTED